MDSLLDVTALFAIVLALALLIERFLEVVKSLYDLVDSRLNFYTYWTRRARKTKTLLEKKMNVFEYAAAKDVAAVLRGARDVILNEQGGYGGHVPIISGDLVRTVTVRFLCKVAAMVIGIWLAFRLKIDFTLIWQNTHAALNQKELQEGANNFGMVLSGIAIGLGSGPVHKIIVTMERRRALRRKKGVKK